MSKYKIRIQYRTGNSFGSSEEEDYIEDDLEWENIDIVSQNVTAIREHDEMVSEIGYLIRRRSDTIKDIESKYKDKTWYVKPVALGYYPIKILLDNGNFMQMCPFWHGYFEQLLGVNVEDTELSNISFKKI